MLIRNCKALQNWPQAIAPTTPSLPASLRMARPLILGSNYLGSYPSSPPAMWLWVNYLISSLQFPYMWQRPLCRIVVRIKLLLVEHLEQCLALINTQGLWTLNLVYSSYNGAAIQQMCSAITSALIQSSPPYFSLLVSPRKRFCFSLTTLFQTTSICTPLPHTLLFLTVLIITYYIIISLFIVPPTKRQAPWQQIFYLFHVYLLPNT